MRREDRRITDSAEVETILRTGRFIALALAGDEPYVVTLSYGYDANANALYFHVAHEGRKLDRVARDPRACGTIVVDDGYTQGECEHPFRSVVLTGRMRVLESADEKRHAIETLVRHLEDRPDDYWESRSWGLDSRLAGFTALAFDIEHIDAKQGK